MKFGIFHSIQWPRGNDQKRLYDRALAQAVLADELGYESLWVAEHHFSRHGIVPDSLLFLGHLAALTRRIRLGTAVSVLPFHNPIRIAESAAMVDLLSGGRLNFGIGKGYQASEFAGFDVNMGERDALFRRALDGILEAWDEHRFSEDAPGPQPMPLQTPRPPIWLATDSHDGLLTCARNGWGILLPQGRPLELVARQVESYREACREAAVAFDPAKVVLARAMFVAETDEAAWETAAAPYRAFLGRMNASAWNDTGDFISADVDRETVVRDSVMFGAPSTCAAYIEQLAGLGVGNVILFVNIAGISDADVGASMIRFVEDVIPRVSG